MKVLNILSSVLTIVSVGVGLAASVVNAKKLDLTIDEKVTKALNQKSES